MDKQQRREQFMRQHPAHRDKYYTRLQDTPEGRIVLREREKRRRDIIELRTVHKWTYGDIAEKFGVTPQYIHEVCSKEGVGKIIGLRTKHMAKIKKMISLSEEQNDALKSLMKADIVDDSDTSMYVGLLIGAEVRRRADKRPVGRPRNEEGGGIDSEPAIDYTDDVPKNIPHFGRMVGKREYADIKALSEAFKQGL